MRDAPRVALLAREGEARAQIRAALTELGAQVVAEGDPQMLAPDEVAAQRPGVLLISLEAAIEDTLDRFGPLMADPDVEVIFDDAEVTGKLSGWDLARWSRHLAAKLLGRGDLLPPLPDGAVPLTGPPDLEPGAPPAPADELAGERFEDYVADTERLAERVPAAPALAEAERFAAAPGDASSFEIEPMELEGSIERVVDVPVSDGMADAGGDSADDAGADELRVEGDRFAPADVDVEDLEFAGGLDEIDLDALDAQLAEGSAPEARDDASVATPADFEFEPEATVSFAVGPEQAIDETPVDPELAALAAQFDDASDAQHAPAAESPAAGTSAAPPAPGGTKPRFDFANLELAPLDDAPAAAAPRTTATGAEFADGGFSLAPVSSAATRAVAVIAGLGGPDAVRQFLAALPGALTAPVLLAQHLDAGKHDRLVTQLGKASRLPVYLAEEGQRARAGEVAVLPAQLGIQADADGLRFVAGGGAATLLRALGDGSIAVLLSGADIAAVDPAAALAANGGLALAQDPVACFDAVAAQALAGRGAVVAAPAELAAQVTTWFAS